MVQPFILSQSYDTTHEALVGIAIITKTAGATLKNATMVPVYA